MHMAVCSLLQQKWQSGSYFSQAVVMVLTVPPTNIFLVSELPLPEFLGTAALASTFLPSMMCCRVCKDRTANIWCLSLPDASLDL